MFDRMKVFSMAQQAVAYVFHIVTMDLKIYFRMYLRETECSNVVSTEVV